MKIKFEWELINDGYHDETSFEGTDRAKVIGGWLVRYEHLLGREENGWSHSSYTMVFVPDPKHEWEIEEN